MESKQSPLQSPAPPVDGCNTLKSRQRPVLNESSACTFTVKWPCGIVFGIKEFFVCESLGQVLVCVLETFAVLEEFGVLCGLDGMAFDDMCHLAEFIDNSRELKALADNPVLPHLLRIRKVIDRLHGRNHVRHVCKTLYNADNYDEFKNVNTQACEQYNKYLKRHKAQLRHMNRSRFNLYLLNIVDLHNAALALDCVSTTSDLLHKGRRNR
jgi:hypothetical protein